MTLPKVKCLIPSPHGFVLADDVVCELPIRLTRHNGWQTLPPVITYGQYFQGITEVISEDGCRPLALAAARQQEKAVAPAEIEEVLIYAEKHGSDYHPARIEVIVNDLVYGTFVMNVAVTARGRARLCHEFEVLRYLNGKYGLPYLPQVYFQAKCPNHEGRNGESAVMFLGDWFQGYCEFHLSSDDQGGSRISLWETDQGRRPLPPKEAREIYRQAARIMTLYYDVDTFEQIFPWHHAAGDFVVKPKGQTVDVRLVTARQYAPMLEPSQAVSSREALLFFLLNLSIRMRLDRLDGTGPVAWADDDCVPATLKGFWAGLRTKEAKGVLEAGFISEFMDYLGQLAEEDLLDGCRALVDACDQAAPDVPVMRQHLARHASTLFRALQHPRNA